MSATHSIQVGDVFGRLTVVSEDSTTSGNQKMVTCRCECGATKTVLAKYLRHGDTKSCGCFKVDLLVARAKTHGHAGLGDKMSPTYKTWASMLGRCKYKNYSDNARYGARGIEVCERWRGRTGFANFLADMGEKPTGLSIDRIDNDRGYSPENCQWATAKQQARNRRTSHMITFRNKTMSLAEWEEESGIKAASIRYRLGRGWSVERALTTPSVK